MTKGEIIRDLADHKVVEKMVVNIAHHPMSADLEDLGQMVYMALLEYDEKAVVEMYDAGQIRFFIARIIMNQYRSDFSPFYRVIRKYQRMSEEIGTRDVASDGEFVPAVQESSTRENRKECGDNLEELVCDFKDIKKEYAYNGTIFSQDDAWMKKLKFIIEKDLNVVDRTIIILYADCQSLRDLGQQLGVSHATIWNEIKRIRKFVTEKMKEK